jgi:hypothetical protein
MRRALALGVLGLLLSVPPIASADGDPASDVLLGQDVFLPYSPVLQSHQRELYSITAAARDAGFPVKVAVIASKSDLGVVPALFGKPLTYARFLSSELGGVFGGPVLVVMPTGFGVAAGGSPRPVGALRDLAPSPGADGLVLTAVSAVPKLAAASGHPLPAGAVAQASTSGASPATVNHALSAIFILVAVTALSCAAAFALRARRARELVRR